MRAFNLIPADERPGAGAGLSGPGKSGGSAYVVLGLLAVLAVFALLYGLASRKVSSETAKVATLTAQAQAAQAQATRLAPYVSFIALHEQRVQAVDSLVNSRFDWAHAFHELGRVLPPRVVSLTALTGAIGTSTAGAAPASAAPAPSPSTGPAAKGASSSSGASSPSGPTPTAAAGATESSATSATPPGSVPTFTLSGCATNQAVVALTLERLRLINGVSEVTLQSSIQAARAGSGSGSPGSCRGPVFAMQITFDPLPSAAATSTTGATSATPTGSAAALTPSTGQPATSPGGVR